MLNATLKNYEYFKFLFIDENGRPVPLFKGPVTTPGNIRYLTTSSTVEYRYEKYVAESGVEIRVEIPKAYLGKDIYGLLLVRCGKIMIKKGKWFRVAEEKPSEIRVEIPPFPPFPPYSTPSVEPPIVIYREPQNRFMITAGSRGHKPASFEDTQRNANWSANIGIGYDFDGVTLKVQDIYGRAADLPNFNPISTMDTANTVRLGAGFLDDTLTFWGGPITTTNASASFSVGAELKREFDYVGPTELTLNTDLWNKAYVTGSVTPLRWKFDKHWVGLRGATYAHLVAPSLYFIQSGLGLGAQFENGPLTLNVFADYALGGTKYADGKEVSGALYSGLQVTLRPVKGENK